MIELIPAIDIMGGKCVRLTQGNYNTQKVYSDDPLEIAKMFEGCGLKRLHVVDLDGARIGKIINHKTLNRLSTNTSLVIDFGGGLKTEKDVEIAFENGACLVTGGSVAVEAPQLFEAWLNRFGADRIILGADAKDEKIAINGWLATTSKPLIPFIEDYYQRGVKKVICTDIGRDGMLSGPSIDLYIKIRKALPDIYLIASGGVSSIHDIERLDHVSIPAVIFGKAFYEGHIKLEDLVVSSQ